MDVTLLTGFGHEDEFVREILDWYEPRVKDARDFALTHQVLLVELKGEPEILERLAQLRAVG